MSREERIKAILKEEADEAFKNGIATGLAAAERIALWYAANPTLKEPHSDETIKQWVDKELEQLRAKLRPS